MLKSEAILFLGEVHILSEASYLIRIYKKAHQGYLHSRILQSPSDDTPPLIINESIVNDHLPST